jgi:hypothetical protein
VGYIFSSLPSERVCYHIHDSDIISVLKHVLDGLLNDILAAVLLRVNIVAADPTRADLDVNAVNVLSRIQRLEEDQFNDVVGCLPKAIDQFSERIISSYQSLLDGQGETGSWEECHTRLSEQAKGMCAKAQRWGSEYEKSYNALREYEVSLSRVFLPSSADETKGQLTGLRHFHYNHSSVAYEGHCTVRHWFDLMRLFKGAPRNDTARNDTNNDLVSSLDHRLQNISGHLHSIEGFMEAKEQSLVALSTFPSGRERQFRPDRLDAEDAGCHLLEEAFQSTKAALISLPDPMEGAPCGDTAAQSIVSGFLVSCTPDAHSMLGADTDHTIPYWFGAECAAREADTVQTSRHRQQSTTIEIEDGKLISAI